MFSRPALLKHTFKSTLNYLKVDSAAHIHHFCCPQNLKLPSQTNKLRNIKNCRTSSFSTVLQARHESTNTLGSVAHSNERFAGLDPIPDPPSVATPTAPADVTASVQSGSSLAESAPVGNSYDSVSNTFPDVYKVAMEVFSSFPVEEDLAKAHASKPASKTSEESLEIGPDIYKTAMEIWNDPDSSGVDGEPSVDVENIAFDSSSSQKLQGGTTSDIPSVLDPHQPSESNYVSIFDSLPEPPAVNGQVSVTESFGHETPFSELGLGGWTPPGMVQNCLEFFHVDLGLPWWQAVVAGTIIIRLLMFPVVVLAQRNMAKLNNNMPQMQLLQSKVTDARQRGDKLEVHKCAASIANPELRIEGHILESEFWNEPSLYLKLNNNKPFVSAARYTGEMMKFMNEKKINPFKNMLPSLFQAPIFLSVFMGMRRMANLPVESLKTGGTLWFVDLTVPDQFYLLPIITSATLFCTIKLGAEASPTSSQNMHLMKYLMMGLPLLVLPFTVSFPGLILVYWTTSNFVSLVQVGVLRIPKVRDYFKIEKLVRHQPSSLAIKDKGFLGNMKDAWNNVKITSELQERERADRMAFMKAGRDPIKKTYKYDPTKVKPAIQAKKAS